MTFPSGFEASLSFLSSEELEHFKQAIHENPVTSLRINDKKWDQSVNLEPVPWSHHGYYLDHRPTFTCDPLFHAGVYYVQESSSMVIGKIVRKLISQMQDHALVLDLCAAPGGKSTDLVANLREGDVLLSNEVIQSRARILRENVTKWGASAHLVSSNDPADFRDLNGLFDVLLIDAPCSGEGLFRKDPESVKEWSREAIELCQKRQQRILADAWNCLAEDGFLIYATCTYNQSENEGVLRWLNQTHQVAPISFSWEKHDFKEFDVDGFPLYKAFPHHLKGEGFSFFVVQKKETVDPVSIRSNRKKKNQPKKLAVDQYLNQPKAEGILQEEVLMYFEDYPLRDFLSARLHLLRSGVRIGEMKKNKLVPDHELAMSDQINVQYPSIDLDVEQAIKFLQKEPFELTSLQRGIHLVRYRGVNLGFINHLGNRFNSLLPSALRIRMQGCKDMIPQIL